jgi:hypothetical protein
LAIRQGRPARRPPNAVTSPGLQRALSTTATTAGDARVGRFGCILARMKVETTVFLSEEIVAALGARATDPERRSELVEAALREYLPLLQKRDPSRDLEIINAHAAELNKEAEEVLSYQVIP